MTYVASTSPTPTVRNAVTAAGAGAAAHGRQLRGHRPVHAILGKNGPHDLAFFGRSCRST